jgi:phospholipid/cholesterol/gamma-HCH transport system substrate-binding protein
MSRFSTEVRVGFFVLSGVALMVAFILILGDFSLKRSMTHYVDFGYSGGLQVGAPVKISGIKIGRVSSLELLAKEPAPPAATATGGLGQAAAPMVRATLKVYTDAAPLFTRNARLAVGTVGLIGEPYLELMPGTLGDPALPAESATRGVDAVKYHVMPVQVAAILQAVGGVIGAEEELGLGEVGASVAGLMTTLNELVGDRRQELGQGLADLALSARDFSIILNEVKGWVGPGEPLSKAVLEGQETISEVHKQLPDVLKLVKGSLTSVKALTDRADVAVSDAVVEEMVGSLRQTTKRLEQLTQDTQKMVNLMKRGEGTVGGLVKDPQIYDDLKEMMRDLKRNPWKFIWRD